MGVTVAVSAAVVAEAAAIASAGYVAGILLRALAVAVAKLLLPAFAAAAGGAVLLLAGAGLEALGLGGLGNSGTCRSCGSLNGRDGLLTAGLCVLLGVGAFVLALAATTATALRLPHAMLHVLRCELRLPVLLAG
jgi:hypothetical protein